MSLLYMLVVGEFLLIQKAKKKKKYYSSKDDHVRCPVEQ